MNQKVELTHSESEKSITPNEFQLFLDSFPILELPIVLKGCKLDYSKLLSVNKGNTYYVGKFETNGNYFATITLGLADCMLPIMTTYNKMGKLIDSKMLAIGYCGSGPCFEREKYMIIKKDFSLYTSDTIASSECDENYDPIPGTESLEVIYKKGNVIRIR